MSKYTETEYNYEYRGHKVKLLGIFQKSDVLSPSPMMGGHNGGTVSYPVAIVEHEDGSMGEVFPADLKRVRK